MTLAHRVGSEIDGSTPPTDGELILAVRAGDRHAYGTLYERHLAAARAHARQLTRSSTDADELVAEAFAKVFAALRTGQGPDRAFRAYLLTTLRNGLYDRMRRDRRLELSDDMEQHDHGIPWSDPVEAELNALLVARAFSALPERWQTVLWQSEVDQRSPAEIGEELGLRPNAVAALAYRAREGLRQAYLHAHVTEYPDEDCRPTVVRLGGWTRGRLSPGDNALVREHLTGCDRCQGLAAELADVNGGIRGLLAPLAVAGSAAGYASSAAGIASVGAAGSGAVVGAASPPAAGAGSVVGSALGWLLGTQGGQVVAAVVTVVAVGGTAAVTGAGVTGPAEKRPIAAAAVAVSADRTGSAPPRLHRARLGPQPTVVREKDKPPAVEASRGKSSGGRSSGGKSVSGTPAHGRAAERSSNGGASSSQAPPSVKVPDANSSKAKPAQAWTSHVGSPKSRPVSTAATSHSANTPLAASARAKTGHPSGN